MGVVKNILKQLLKQTTIVEKKKLSDAAYRIKLKGGHIKNAEFTPGYFLRVGVGLQESDLSLHDSIRSYSVWDIDQREGTLDMAVATHSKGSGADWSEQCKVGETVFFNWKKGKFILDNTADSYLFIGDLSALSHLYIITRNLPQNKQVESVLYSQDARDFFPDVNGERPFNMYQMPENPTVQVIGKIKEIVPNMKGEKMVYIAGDSRLCLSLTQYFRKELGWKTTQIKTKPFWNPDKKGLE